MNVRDCGFIYLFIYNTQAQVGIRILGLGPINMQYTW